MMGGSPKEKKLARNRAAPLSESRRGRPSSARVEAINRAIVDAALDRFIELGFESASMEAVAAAAGVSKATLYARFSTKEALLKAVVQHQIDLWSDLAPQREVKSGTLEERLREYAYGVVNSSIWEEIRRLEQIASTVSVREQLLAVLHEVGHRRMTKLIADEIVNASVSGNCPHPNNAEQAAEMLLSILYGWHRRLRVSGPPSEAEARNYADAAVDVLIRGSAAW